MIMTSARDVAGLLAKSKLFGDLSDEVREAIAGDMRPVSFGAGEAIFSRGDVGKDIYLVLQGRVRLSVLSLEGRELSFSHAADGDVFGEIAALDGDVRTADATAVTKVTGMSLSRAAFDRHFENAPELARAAIKFLCQRIRDTDMQLEGVALHRIEVRLARYITSRLDQAERSEDISEDAPTIDLGMSQGELSLLLGASRPKVNAALMLLEESGAITRKGNKITCNRDILEDIGEVE